MTKVLGITGGIATGKSTVVALFKKAGYPIVDGDIIAREIVAKGQPALAAIVETFGPEIVLTTGELDRKKLGQLIFANPQKRELLNVIKKNLNMYYSDILKNKIITIKYKLLISMLNYNPGIVIRINSLRGR